MTEADTYERTGTDERIRRMILAWLRDREYKKPPDVLYGCGIGAALLRRHGLAIRVLTMCRLQRGIDREAQASTERHGYRHFDTLFDGQLQYG